MRLRQRVVCTVAGHTDRNMNKLMTDHSIAEVRIHTKMTDRT